jgi:hypothetical protein
MSDVENKQANFSALLVYDVSRWGRSQDEDESAYYEYVLRRAGIRVHYCAEQFEKDGRMSSFRAQDIEAFDDRRMQPGADILGWPPGVLVEPRWGDDARFSVRGSGLFRTMAKET